MTTPKAVLFVRNAFTHDARVLRAAQTLRAVGFEPLVVAVVSTDVLDRSDRKAGVPVLRLAPGSPLSWLRERLRRVPLRASAERSSQNAVRPLPAVPGGSLLVRLHRYLRTLDYYRRAIGALRRLEPDLVHCNDYNTMWIGVWARLFSPAAVVYDAHEIWPDRNQRPEPRWWLLACESLFVRCAHAVVTASPGYADVMARRYRIARPLVVRNIPPRPSQDGPAAVDLRRLVYAGALAPHRGLEQAISALAGVPGARLRLLGPGRPGYVTTLLEHARRVGVADRVEVAARVEPGEVVGALAGAGLGLALFQPVCLSHRLVAPNKLFEYMVAGVPSLASDLPVISAFVAQHGVGMTVAATDVAAIADAMRTMLEPERNAQLRAATAIAAGTVTWERERRILVGAYEDASARVDRV